MMQDYEDFVGSRTAALSYLKRKDKKLAWLIDKLGIIDRYESKDDFAFLVEQIIGQMLSIKAADTIATRLRVLCGGEIEAKSIYKLSDQDLKATGISARKCACIKELAQGIISGELDFALIRNLSDSEIMQKLTTIKGIGNWTAKMYLYKIYRPDVLPYEDLTFLAAYKWLYKTSDTSPAAVKKRCQRWSPYSSFAAMYLYTAFTEKLLETPSPRLKDL